MDDPANVVPAFPRLWPNVDFAFVGDGSVLVRGQSGSISLRGAFVSDALPDLLPSHDGRSSREVLVRKIDPAFQREAEEFLAIMSRRGFLADGVAQNGHANGRYASWGLFGADAKGAEDRLAAARILVLGLGVVGTALTRALVRGGVGRCDQRPPSDVTDEDAPTMIVLVSDGMSLVGVDRVSELSHRDDVPWLLVRIDRSTVLVGPYVVPGQTACFCCYELRARANADHPEEHEALFDMWRKAEQRGDQVPPEYGMIVGNWLALDLMRSIATGRLPSAAGRLISLNLHSLSSSSRDILRLPRCPVCSRQVSWPLTRIWDIPKTNARS